MGGESRETWARRVERLERSRKSIGEFAAREGVSAGTLKWWKWKLGREREARRGREAARKRRAARKAQVQFVEVVPRAVGSGGGEPFEVELSRGYRVRVPAGFETGALERLLGVLERR